jgi:hypothetical protein
MLVNVVAVNNLICMKQSLGWYTRHVPNYPGTQRHLYHGKMTAWLWKPCLNHREDHTPLTNLTSVVELKKVELLWMYLLKGNEIIVWSI